MAHVVKYTKSAIGHLLKHYERAKDEIGNYINFGNENIDTNKTHLNYNLADNKNQMEFLKNRMSEVKCLNRKDVNVMCSWIVTKPKDIPKDLEEKFFKESYNFLENRYGKNNIISSYVHMDEATPHMHFSFIPITLDKKKNIEKLSAKEVVNRKDLRTFHTDLENHLEKALGQKVNILNEATREGNKAIADLKKETLAKEVAEVNQKLKKAHDVSKELSSMEEHSKALLDKLDKIEVKKNLIGGKLSISEQDYSTLRHLATEGESLRFENLKLRSKISKLEKELEVIEKELSSKSEALNKNFERFEDMERKYRNMVKYSKHYKNLEKAIENLGLSEKVTKEIKNIVQRNRALGVER